MTLADALAAEEAAHSKGPACTVALILDQLDPADRAVLVEWLANPVKRHSWIAEALRKNGHQVQESTIGRHRNRKCTCS